VDPLTEIDGLSRSAKTADSLYYADRAQPAEHAVASLCFEASLVAGRAGTGFLVFALVKNFF